MKWLKWVWEFVFKYRDFQVIRWRPLFIHVSWWPRIGFDFAFDVRWEPWHNACTEERHHYGWRPEGCKGWNSDFALSITIFWINVAVDIPNPNIIDEKEDEAVCCEGPGNGCTCDPEDLLGPMLVPYEPATKRAKNVHVCGICDDCTMCNKDCCNDCVWEADYPGGSMKPYCNCEDHSCPTYNARRAQPAPFEAGEN